MKQQTASFSYYPISYAQHRLWVIDQFEEARGAYNMPYVFEVADLDLTAFQKAVNALVERHDILRTTFVLADSVPVQKIWDTGWTMPDTQYIDLRTQQDIPKVVSAYLKQDAWKPFDLQEGPLLRFSVLQTSDNHFSIVLNQHHIISDGWSMNIIIRDLTQLYMAFYEGVQSGLPALPIQYKDYVLWQQNQLNMGKWDQSRHYWLKQLKGQLPVLQLPSDHPRPATKRYEGAEMTFTLEKDLLRGFQRVCMENGATLFMGFMALSCILLYRYTSQSDLVIGTPIAGRDRLELEDQLGFYINTLALRIPFDGKDTFLTVLSKVKEATLGAYEHQHYPFDRLVDELELERDLSRTPLFDVMVLQQTTEEEMGDIKDVQNRTEVISKFDLTFSFIESSNTITGSITYSIHLFKPERIARMARHLKQLVKKVIEGPGQAVQSINYLSEEECARLSAFSHGQRSEYPADKTIHQLIEEQAAITPAAVAVKYKERSLAYKDLDDHGNRLAGFLRKEHGIGTGHRIGVLFSRTEWLPVILLGILKTGAAYVPLDPDYPLTRLQFIAADAQASLIITDQTVAAEAVLKDLLTTCPVIDYDEERKLIDQYPAEPMADHVAAASLAYLIYTSGTTGVPKGVCLTHQNAVALLSWARQEFGESRFETVVASTSYCFDLSIFELFYPLSIGKQLRIVQNAFELPTWIKREHDLLINTVPSVVQSLLQEGIPLDNIQVLNMAGEPVPPAIPDKLGVYEREVRNLYGPSEYATYSTCYRFYQAGNTVLIGKPLPNTEVYILDEHHHVLPEGITGELYISGAQLAQGYLNKPALTAERFIPHPFEAGKRIYKTGDMGRWTEDGNIQLLGRKDSQIKLRGYRIELGEIETVMAQHEAIEQAIVLLKTFKEGDQQLVAYYTGQAIPADELRSFAERSLPRYMIPSCWIPMESFPLSPNGKIDRSRLPEPATMVVDKEDVVPVTIQEMKLLAIWREVLKRDQLQVKDNFFEQGGQSLKAMQIVSRVNAHWDAAITMKDIFNYPSVQQLTAVLEKEVKRSALVKLNTLSPGHPSLLFLPSLMGAASLFRKLAQKVEGQYNCYGLEYEAASDSIPALARHSVGSLTEIQHSKEITLVGYSMGALVAFELARVLEEQDWLVRLVLLDRGVKTTGYQHYIEQASAEEMNALFNQEVNAWVEGIDDLASLAKYKEIFIHNLDLIDKYITTGKVQCEVVAIEANNAKVTAHMQQWKEYTSGGFRHTYIEGSHQEVLNEVNSDVIIELLGLNQQNISVLAH